MITSERASTGQAAGSIKQPRPANDAYYPALDGLRAVAFLMVFGYHYCGLPWGWTGVDLFFVLSGFLITGILLDTSDDPHRIRNFYVRRTLRIFPLYYGVFLLLALSYPVFRWRWNWIWLSWPAYLGNWVQFFYHFAPASQLLSVSDANLASARFPKVVLSLGHFWTLSMEEQFYLFWPCVVFWVRSRRRLIFICCASVVICPVLRMAAPSLLPASMVADAATLWSTPFRLDALLIGGLLALLRRGEHSQALSTAARVALAVLVMVAAVWLVVNGWRLQRSGYSYPPWFSTWGLTFVDLLGAALLITTLDTRSVVYWALNRRALRWVGRISYGAYVFHDIPHAMLVRTARHFFPANWRFASVALALAYTLTLAWASFRFYESRFLALKARFTQR